MFSCQTTSETVNLTFSKEFLSNQEFVKLIEKLRVQELISRRQATADDVMTIDEELKTAWWDENHARFLSKIE